MMKIFVISLTLSLAAITASCQSPDPTPSSASPQPAHVVNTIRFEVAAPMSRVAPMFAPEAERAWAGKEWNPVFLYPQPGRDVQGAVWTTQHGPFTIWVNTLFDVPAGHMEYVATIVEHMVITIDVRVTALARARTAVELTFTRTALNPAANDDVRAEGQNDRTSGPEWQQGVEAGLGLTKK